jgi:hypothetical protein
MADLLQLIAIFDQPMSDYLPVDEHRTFVIYAEAVLKPIDRYLRIGQSRSSVWTLLTG